MLKQELSASHALAFAGKISQITFAVHLAFWIDARKCTASDWMRSAVPPLMGVHKVLLVLSTLVAHLHFGGGSAVLCFAACYVVFSPILAPYKSWFVVSSSTRASRHCCTPSDFVSTMSPVRVAVPSFAAAAERRSFTRVFV
ncbi:hypothetical protein PIB30_037005 [Stylosanthes scabra]|uniref:Uncharacterized protein n=1 Tax=Stylosanthes scabra TaxID=79078 RepID=A0ABU6QDQ9_9FABA|nr:hypothetical protein [Stylosanthes scabra]